MKVTIRVKGTEYEIFGVEGIEPMANNKTGLCFYFMSQMDGRWIQFTKNAKIVSVRVCELGNEFTTYETKQALGWL